MKYNQVYIRIGYLYKRYKQYKQYKLFILFIPLLAGNAGSGWYPWRGDGEGPVSRWILGILSPRNKGEVNRLTAKPGTRSTVQPENFFIYNRPFLYYNLPNRWMDGVNGHYYCIHRLADCKALSRRRGICTLYHWSYWFRQVRLLLSRNFSKSLRTSAA